MRYWIFYPSSRMWSECSHLSYLLGKKTKWLVAKGKENA